MGLPRDDRPDMLGNSQTQPQGLASTWPYSPRAWVLPPLSNSWIISIIGLYIALNRTPNIDCYWVGAVPNLWLLKMRAFNLTTLG